MKRACPALVLAAAIALSGCSALSSDPGGPPTISASPASADSSLAAEYRRTGGRPDVSGIKHAKNSKGVLELTVWTRRRDGYADFDAFARTLESFLAGKGVDLAHGYVLDVYALDGTRVHKYDTTPEHNP
ncbi:hypothetical protein ABZ845_26505 [Streptomyces sp. NPDC047022]|uniref:hypothetical protein n=1 Tax=Streptomyces sp. NPDC047022 TaxID=3155737 RepID=UPI0033F6B111